MKFIAYCLISGILLFQNTSFSQNIDNLMVKKKLTCEDIALNCSNLIMKYYNKGMNDSVKIILNYWYMKCGISEPYLRAKILFAIKDSTFNEDMYDSNIIYYIRNYEYRMKNDVNEFDYNKYFYGYIPLREEYDSFTAKLANVLLEKQKINTVEYLFCELYSNNDFNFLIKIQQPEYIYTSVRHYYNQITFLIKKQIDWHLSIFTGIWIPSGKLNIVGNHPVFGFQLGMKYNQFVYNFTIGLKFGKSENEYLVEYKGNIEKTNYFFGGYLGLDTEYEFMKLGKHDYFLIFGFGYDGFSTIDTKGNTEEKGKEISSLNINIGIGYRMNFNNKYYIGFQTKYNFLNYNNPNGTDMSGNAITFSLFFGGFSNPSKYERLKILKYKEY